jgi:hypothetical protein
LLRGQTKQTIEIDGGVEVARQQGKEACKKRNMLAGMAAKAAQCFRHPQPNHDSLCGTKQDCFCRMACELRYSISGNFWISLEIQR